MQATDNNGDTIFEPPYITAMKSEMIKQAIEKFGKVYPTPKAGSLEKSFTVFELRGKRKLQFWYNDLYGSTHLISRDFPEHNN